VVTHDAVPPRVVLCDDQTAMRDAFRSILNGAGIEVVGEARDGDEAVAITRATRPDVVLMDVRMPHRDGISATAEIAATMPDQRVVVLTTFDSDDVLFGALGAGAAGFVLKNSPPEDLVRAVRDVVAGDAVLDRTVAMRVFARFAPPAPPHDATLDRFTERERDVLWLVAQGMTNAEVARRLGVGEATAKTHVSRVLMKLGVRDRVQAVIHAHRTGFASSPRAIG
jgi:DNA-binding NarL/FixJ family response regulator